MKKSIRLFMALAMAGALAGGASADMAQGAGGGDRHGIKKCLSILDLTEAEKSAIKGILSAEKDTVKAIVAKLKTDGQALKALLQGSNPDACAVGTAMLKVSADRHELRAERQKIETAIEGVLTPDQKARFQGCLDGHAATTADVAAEGDEVEE